MLTKLQASQKPRQRKIQKKKKKETLSERCIPSELRQKIIDDIDDLRYKIIWWSKLNIII